MLTLRIHNTGKGNNENASYEYWVFVNGKEIDRGNVVGHNRKDGWVKLVKLISENYWENRCGWNLEDEDTNNWVSECGHSFWFEQGDPKENKMNFCPYCGKKLIIL